MTSQAQEKEEEETQKKLNAVLDAALDDLDDDSDDDEGEQQQQPQAPRPVQGPMPPPPSPTDPMGSIDEMMKQLLQGDLGDGNNGQSEEFLGRLLQEMQTQIGAELEQVEKESAPSSESKPKKQSASKKSTPPQQSTKNNSKDSNGESEVDQAISSLVEGMTNQAKLDPPNNSNTGMEDEMLRNMMNQLGEGLGGGGGGDDAGFNPDALIDGMMEQLLAKDLMYEPMKKVAEKFPAWLEQNKEKLPKEEYEQRSKQYQCFQKLVHTYDTEPENVQLLMLLMQEVQEFGQPPPEIIQDIAPGLEFDADGLPKMDGAAGGLPFPAAGDEECRIM